MKRKSKEEIVKALMPTRKRLEQWRKKQGSSGTAIPEDLWQEAATLALSYGVSTVCKELRLGYYNLKDRVIERTTAASEDSVSAFVEIAQPLQRVPCRNTIEISKKSGARIRLELESDAPKELVRLSERLWRAAK